MALDPKDKKQIESIIGALDDGIQSIASAFAANLKSAISNVDDDINRSITKDLARGINNEFRAIIRLTDKIADTRLDITKGQADSKKIAEEREKIVLRTAQAKLKYDELSAALIDEQNQAGLKGDLEAVNNLAIRRAEAAKDYENFKISAKARKKSFEGLFKTQKSIEEATGGMGEIFRRLEKNRFFGSLINADEAVKGMKQKAFQLAGEKGFGGLSGKFSMMGAGLKSIGKGLGPLAIFTAVIKVIKEFIQLSFRASEIQTNIAKAMGSTMQNAKGFTRALQLAANENDRVFYTVQELTKSVGEIVEQEGLITKNMAQQAIQVNFLTQGLGIASSNATNLANVFYNIGSTAELTLNKFGGMAQELQKTSRLGLTARQVMKDLGSVSADILATFSGNTDEMFKAVEQTRRFGVTLTQAKNIANSLLNFESSIASELETEILLGKQFNFEKARALAAAGDYAGATAEVLKQTEDLNDEALKSPLIQESLAKSVGLNTDELFRAREITKKLNLDANEYNELLQTGSDIIGEDAIMRLMREKDSAEAVKQTLSQQVKFNRALEQAKDQFATFVGTGALDKLSNLLPKIIKALAKNFGDDVDVASIEASDEIKDRLKNTDLSKDDQQRLEKEVQRRIKLYDQSFQRGVEDAGDLRARFTERAIPRSGGVTTKGGLDDSQALPAIIESVMGDVNKTLNMLNQEMKKNTKAVEDTNLNNFNK